MGKLKCDELGVNFINLNHNCENNNPISLSAYLRLNEISKNEKIEDLNLTYKSLEKEKYF